MNGFSIAGLVFVFLPSIALGLFVLIKNKTNVGRLWAAFLFAVSLWGLGMYMIGNSTDQIRSLFWWRVAEVGVILIPVLLTNFVIAFLKLKRTILLVLFYLVTLFFLYCDIFTNYFIDRLYFAFDQFYYILETPFYTVFIGIFILTVLYVLWELYLGYKRTNGVERSQIKYLFWAFAVGFSGGLTSYFPVYKSNIYPVWNATIFVSIVLVTYAILRYRFMDLRQIGRAVLIYFIDSILVYGFFNLLVLGYVYIWGSVWNSSALIAGIFIAPGFVYGIFSFNEAVTKFVDRYFFFSLYDYRQTITKLSSKLNTYNDLNKIVDLIVDTIKGTMKLNRAGVLLIDKKDGDIHYKIAKVVGFDITNGISLVKDNFLTQYLKRTATPLIRDELAIIARNSRSVRDGVRLLDLEKEMAHIEASLCLPLLSSGELRGIIVLGAKESGDPYTNQDLELLNTVTVQAGTAIDNARLYQETKNFNKVLQQKVDEQTNELKDRAVHLEKLLKMREEFLDIASHQLKTPVSVIRGTISMFRDGSMDKLPEVEKKKFFDNIYHKTEKLNVIISDILRASEIESEEFKIDAKSSKKVQLEEILKSIYDDLNGLAKDKGIKLELVLPPKKLAPLMTSADFLEQAIYNLVDNAIKYTMKGFVRVELSSDEPGILTVKVSDSGIGIPAADQKKMFDKFSRAKNAVNMYTDGTGLGLFIAKQIVEAHDGGSLVFVSKEGEGTTFTVKLKAVK